jgi:hypothetical protein
VVAELERIRREDVLRAVQGTTTGSATAAAPDAPPDAAFRLVRGDREHDVVGLVDEAYWLATGDVLAEDVDAPDARDCALLLRGLGFEVVGDGLPPLRFTSATTVGAEHSRATWALAARERLLEVAGVYGDSITVPELADFVQRRSLVRTTAQPRSWIGEVLARVAEGCIERREPLLTALVVDGHGKVGASYETALATRGEDPADVDAQAAEERLACHRRFGAEMPADGGSPVVLRPRAAPRRAKATTAGGPGRAAAAGARPARKSPPAARKNRTMGGRRTAEESVAASQAQAQACPVHFTVIGPSGVCDYCE